MVQSAKTRALETSGDHSGVNSHKVKKKKREEKRSRCGAKPGCSRTHHRLSDGRRRAKFTLVTTTAETQNRARAGNKRAAGSGKCVWQEHGQVDELGGANMSLRKRNYSYKGLRHLEGEEQQK